jgi:hypothetical protein
MSGINAHRRTAKLMHNGVSAVNGQFKEVAGTDDAILAEGLLTSNVTGFYD